MRAPLRIRLDRAITVRVGAILGVVLFHAFTVPYGGSFVRLEGAASHAQGPIHRFMTVLLSGLPGLEQFVIIFFIISGYFAHRAYQRARKNRRNRSRRTFVKFFLWRRFWRLVPPFWVALLFSYFVSFDHPFTWDGLRKLAVNASLFKTLYPGYFFSINSAHWYVAVQWQLDLLYPVFLYILARRSTVFAVAVAWLASILVIFVAPYFADPACIHYFPVRWWAEWSLGVYLADRHLAGVRVFPRPYWTLLLTGLALVAGHVAGIHFIEWLALRILLGVAFEGVLLSHSRRRKWERRLAPIGVCSYSLYLLHIPVQQLVSRAARALRADLSSVVVWLLFAVVSFAISFWLARLSMEYVETKSAALGNRLWRRRFLIRAWLRIHRARLLQPVA